MYENLVSQPAGRQLASDIRRGIFPGAVLFSGPDASGKLTAALETARILDCASGGGEWQCSCPSCRRNRSLTSTGMLLCGPRDCFLEIAAAADTFLRAVRNDERYVAAARYLFLRSVRKLTLRFSGILWQGDDRLSKIGAAVSALDELLETLDFPRQLPEFTGLEKMCLEIKEKARKLEEDFLYDSVPVMQIRNMESWAQIKPEHGRKTVIIENADRMQTGVRNALLKILEEPPAGCVFILLTSRRNSVMPTILSRVRTYNFSGRDADGQRQVISRVFHNEEFSGGISDYLLTFLPVPPLKLRAASAEFFAGIAAGKLPDAAAVSSECGKFEPRVELRIFLDALVSSLRPYFRSPAGCEAAADVMAAVRACWDNVSVYNQSPAAALETLVRSISRTNALNGNIFRCEDM